MATGYKTPEVLRQGPLDCQVCVPESWRDDEVQAFAKRENPSGTTGGWQIRRQGDEALGGNDERVPCDHCFDFVHIMLDC